MWVEKWSLRAAILRRVLVSSNSSGGQKSKTQLHWAKVMVSAGLTLEENLFPGIFQLLVALACDPLHQLQSTWLQSQLPWSQHHLFSLCFPLIRTLVVTLGPTWIIQDYRLISQSLTKSLLQGPFCYIKYSQAPGTQTWISLRPLFSLSQYIK